MNVFGIYQAQDHDLAGPYEAFAVDDNTITGRKVIKAFNFKSIGQTTYGYAYPVELLNRKAEDSVDGQYKTAIEPMGDGRWTLTIYERGKLEAITESMHDTMNEAITEGRKLLRDLCYGWKIGKEQQA